MKKGFTLIELLVVVLIIGILSAVALPQYRRAVEKARLSKVLVMMGKIRNALDIYLVSHDGMLEGEYIELLPATGNDSLDIDVESVLNCGSVECEKDDVWYTARIEWGEPAVSAWQASTGYTLRASKNIAVGKWTYTCTVEDPEGGLPDYICKSLISQGWEYINPYQ